ncbi:MAG: hypothetical protein J07HQX50_00422 [Haloquadratum sp. J07HQX50]|nr:MAG: hypothetical protein J07HQX50_00422 [Haloquadratum sp. J07HQX50]
MIIVENPIGFRCLLYITQSALCSVPSDGSL